MAKTLEKQLAKDKKALAPMIKGKLLPSYNKHLKALWLSAITWDVEQRLYMRAMA